MLACPIPRSRARERAIPNLPQLSMRPYTGEIVWRESMS
jgi:hypothetical protein